MLWFVLPVKEGFFMTNSHNIVPQFEVQEDPIENKALEEAIAWYRPPGSDDSAVLFLAALLDSMLAESRTGEDPLTAARWRNLDLLSEHIAGRAISKVTGCTREIAKEVALDYFFAIEQAGATYIAENFDIGKQEAEDIQENIRLETLRASGVLGRPIPKPTDY